jgi:trans-2,3-dihydro-3-hydroxyanthranilate isomerase
MEIPFSFVDVFTGTALSSNPPAVVPNEDSLDELAMQLIAGGFNRAETTFILILG